jgi:hypothetical protein
MEIKMILDNKTQKYYEKTKKTKIKEMKQKTKKSQHSTTNKN